MTDGFEAAFTRDRVAALARVSPRKIDYWRSTNVIEPSIQGRTLSSPIRLYSLTDVLGVLVVAELRVRGVSLQHVRRLVRYVEAYGHASPLTEVRYAVAGQREVYIQHGDGTWEGDRAPGQGILPQVLDLQPLRARIGRATGRTADGVGRLERRRGALGSKELFAGTRVPVDAVKRYLAHGASTDEVVSAYPDLTTADIERLRVAG